MSKPVHHHIRAYDRALELLVAVGDADAQGNGRTVEARQILGAMDKLAAKARRKADRPVVDSSRKDWDDAHEKALDALSIYVRTRDTRLYGEHRRGPCCTCKKPKSFEELGCGHWQSRKHWGTKFHLFNNHGQCWGCNSKMMGNGRMPDHEEYIKLIHGPEWPARLIFLTKTDKREKTTKELLAIAADLQLRTEQHLARETNYG